MSNLASNIGAVTGGKYANAVLYAGLFTLLATEALPSPADVIYNDVEKRIREKWKKGEITPQQYYKKSANSLYMIQPLWWGFALSLVYFWDGDFYTKLKVAAIVVGTGAAIGAMQKIGQKNLDEIHRETKAQIQVTEEALEAEGKIRKNTIQKGKTTIEKGRKYALKKVHNWNYQ